MSVPDRRALVERDDREPSIRKQCKLLGLARSGVYRKVPPANDNDLALMRRIDELFTAWPFLGQWLVRRGDMLHWFVERSARSFVLPTR